MYPVMLSVDNRPCLVVGGGGVALRKVQGLVEDGARVTVVAPRLVEPLERMAAGGRIECRRRPYRAGEAASYALVFAATNDRSVNRAVADDAADAGVWVNVADDPELCSFYLPGRVRRGALELAIGSAGEAPFAVRRLRELLGRRLGPEWTEWLGSAARYRLAVRSLALDRNAQERCYDRFFAATVDGEALAARVPSEAEEEEWLGGAAIDHRLEPLTEATAACRPRAEATVSLVGAGPGDPGLLTVRGHERLARADAVVYDRLAAASLPCDLDPRVELHPVGKTAGVHPVPQEEINALLVRLARAGKRVVRLKGGDPFVFGRGGEEAEVLADEGITFEVVPGVTSGVAAPAAIGIPVTHRREAVRVTLVTAHEAVKSDGAQVSWELLAADPHATIVGYMGVTALAKVAHRLIEAGMDPATPAAMIAQATTSAQRHVVSTVGGLADAVEAAGLHPPAVFVIGPTVGHAERLGRFGRPPLAGERLLIAKSGGVVRQALAEAGAELVELPMPVTPAARVVLAALPLSGSVVCSPAEVDWLDEERAGAEWRAAASVWCVGRETAARAHVHGWPRIVELERGASCAELVAAIARRPAEA